MLIEGETSGDDVKATGRRVGRVLSHGKGTVRQAVNIAGRLVKRHGRGDEKKEKKIRQGYHDSIKQGSLLAMEPPYKQLRKKKPK